MDSEKNHDKHIAAQVPELNYYAAEFLQEIKQTLFLAEPPEGYKPFDGWQGLYAKHVRFLVNELERRLPK